MNREKLQELTMPCLGRPFQLGMLYNCHTDQLVPSITLWNQEKLKQALDSKPQKFSDFEVIAESSIDTKLTNLGVDMNLKLSFLVGLLKVSGAASYLNDQTSSENLVRINLRYQSTAWVDQLAVEKLGNLDNPDVFKDTTATHFVSGLLYGADAIFVFDQEVSHGEKIDVHRFMKEKVELLPTISTSGNAALDISDTDKRKVQKFHCKLYCDLPLTEIPNTFEGAVKLCKDLPKLLSESDSPKMAWLYPLSKLNSKVAPITREISIGLVTQTQDVMESLHEFEMKTNDLMNSEVCAWFPAIKEQLLCFRKRITEYKADFTNNLVALIPKVRSGHKELDVLIELFRVKDISPFSHERLSSWVKGKISEVKVLGKYLKSMKDFEFAFLPGDMESVVGDPEYNQVISFTFKATGKCDPCLERMTTYLQPHATGQEVMNAGIATPWCSDSKIISDMKAQTQLFKKFAKANEQIKETKFVVTSSSDELSEKGAVIELYTEGCDKESFEPPSEPGKPSATSVTHSSIHVNWSKPKYGAQNVQFYNVFYCDLSSSPEQWKVQKTSSTEGSITVNNLDAQKKYCFKVQAVCKAGVSLDSEISDPIQTKVISVAPGRPIVSSVSHNSIQLQWTKPQYGEFNVEVYTISYHEIKDQPELESHWKKVQTEGTKQSETISDLAPQTAYYFKVRAKFKTAGVSLVSETSDPIQTYPVPVPPGKPIASNVTHNSVQLEWSEPQYGGHHIEFYTISYHELKDPPELEKWKEIKTTDNNALTIVSNLAAQTAYSFKVRAQFNADINIDSETSEPVNTKPPPVEPGKPIISCVTHNSLHLEWSKSQYNEEKVELYTIFSHEIKDSRDKEQTWKEIERENPIYTESVTVSSLDSQTEYSFKVHAKFTSGMILVSETSDPIQTYPVPVPPGKPIASNVTHNSVQLKWSKPLYAEAQNVEFYTVFYHEIKEPPDQEPQWKEIRTKDATESAILSDLAAQTQYSIKVHAEFKTGKSLDSDISDPIQTYPVPVPPDKPIASNVTHDSVQLEWSEPQYGGQSVEFYTVLYCEIEDPPNQEQWKDIRVDSTKRSFIVSHLVASTVYSFKVHAQFKAGVVCSEVSDPVQTHPPPVPPGKPFPTSVTYNSVQLEWQKAECAGQNVEFYTVFYHEIKDPPDLEPQWKEIRTKDATESAILSDLAAQTQYSIKVHAEFKTGMSLDSDLSDPIQTYPVPVPPDKPIAPNVTHDSVQLEWSEPQYGGQSVEFYTVLYCEIEDPPNQEQWKDIRVDSTKRSVVVSHLVASTVYSFKVHAQFKAGVVCSEVSDPVQTHPPPVPPGKPFPSSVTYNSVQLKWQKAECAGQNVEFYTVFYHEIKDPPDLEPQWKEIRTKDATESAILSDLAAQTQYSIKVHAEFKTGMSSVSDISDPIQTYPVPVPPDKLIASNVTHDSIQLEWSEPQYVGQSVEFYTVLYCKIEDPPNQEQWKDIRVDSTKRSVVVSHLVASTVYSFKVHAQFKAGVICSEVSDPVQTHPPPVPPGKPFPSSVTYNSVQLKWTKAHYRGQNAELYSVLYREIKAPPGQWKEIKTAKELVTISDLTAEMDYSFKVRAEFTPGMQIVSDISDPIQTYPFPDVPGKPTASNVTHDSIHLGWSEAHYGTLNVISYTLSYYDPVLGQWKEIETSKSSITISKLKAQTEYLFKVTAGFENGMSLASGISDPIQTYPVSVPPGKPIASNVTHDRVKLEWSKSQYKGEDAEFYTLSFKNSSNPKAKWKKLENDPIDQVEIDLMKMDPQQEYLFKIHSNFKGGITLNSEVSDPIRMSPNPIPPDKPTPYDVTHNSIQLRWSEAYYGGQKAESYTIFYHDIKHKQPQKQWKNIQTVNTAILVTHLNAQTTYQFRVCAEFKTGKTLPSELSDPILTKPCSVLPGKPTASNVTHNSVHLEWTKASYGKHKVKFYSVFFRKIEDPSTEELWKERTPNTSVTVTGLAAETNYSFKIQAEFEAGVTLNSEYSGYIQTNRFTVPPSKPISCDITHKSVKLMWSEAQCGVQTLEYYHVFYCKSSDLLQEWKEFTANTFTGVEVRGLDPQTEYSFIIHAKFKDSTTLASEISDPISTYPSPVPPGKPYATKRTHSSVQLEWSRSQNVMQEFEYYAIFYRKCEDQTEVWMEVKSGSPIHKESVLVPDLAPETEYSFKVCAKFKLDTLESAVSDHIHTYPASVVPGKPTAFSVTHNCIQLQWLKPAYGAEYITFYTVLYCEMNDLRNQWKEKQTKGPKESITLSGLGATKQYCCKIRAEIKPCGLTKGTSEISDPIQTKVRIAIQMLSKKPIKEGPLEIHKLPVVEQMGNTSTMIRRCYIGKHPPCMPSQQKVLMVVGATGAGKSTLINGMINYILGVEWQDVFRFKLITDDGKVTQSKSQTKWITAYTITKMEGSPVPYTLTIIDTPGFGDTQGLERDKLITKQIREFFSLKPPCGIDHIDGIGFVTQSGLARLTPTQRYIFSAVVSIFGKDIADNIFMMITFADGQYPPVMAAIKAADIPSNHFYKFNNSALFASNDVDESEEEDLDADNFDRMFFKMGVISFKQFFTDFYGTKSRSLQLTREVLDEREALETTIAGLYPQIKSSLAKIEEMRQEEAVLQKHEADIATNKAFTYVVDITKQRKVDIQGTGKHVTNCLRCNFTCHEDCHIPKDEEKYNCSAMNVEGFCSVCTKKCKWDQHVNNAYYYDIYVEQETRTSDALKKKYYKAVVDKTKTESMMSSIDSQLEAINTEILTMIKQAQKCLHRLSVIALKPNPLTEYDFLDLLIDSEKRECKPGWMNRVQYYESLKEKAKIIQHIQTEDAIQDLEAAADQETPYAPWYRRFPKWVGL